MIWVVAIGFALVLAAIWEIRRLLLGLLQITGVAADRTHHRLEDVRIATEDVARELYAKRRTP